MSAQQEVISGAAMDDASEAASFFDIAEGSHDDFGDASLVRLRAYMSWRDIHDLKSPAAAALRRMTILSTPAQDYTPLTFSQMSDDASREILLPTRRPRFRDQLRARVRYISPPPPHADVITNKLDD